MPSSPFASLFRRHRTAKKSLAPRFHKPEVSLLEERVLLSADLLLSAAAATPTSVLVGDASNVAVTYTVKNQGDFAPSQNWIDSFYLSSKSTFDSSAQLLYVKPRDDNFPLPINGSYTATANVPVPNTALTGANFILVVTNDQNPNVVGSGQVLQESNYANNLFAVPLTLTTPNVDLVVSNASISTNTLEAGNGAKATVQWTTTNQGSGPAQASWSDQIYLSSKTSLDSSAVLLGSFAAPKTLSPSGSYTQSEQVSLPDTTLLGSENVLVVVNSSGGSGGGSFLGAQSETSTTNDTAVLPVTVNRPASLPNFQITNFTTSTSTATLGQTIYATYTVSNTGSGNATGSWDDLIVSSPTATYNSATAHVLGSLAPGASPLNAGASYTETESLVLRQPSAGDKFILVVTNAGDTQAEASLTDNSASQAITLSEPSLAFIAGSLKGPASANLGDSISLQWSVQNTSSTATVVPFSDAVYLSDHSTFDNAAQLVGTFQAPTAGSLAAEASYVQNVSVTLPASETGSCFLLVVADASGGSLSGSFFQTNNQPVSGTTPIVASTTFTLGAADLVMSVSNAPAAAQLGSPFNVAWTVANQGSVAANAAWEDAVFVSSSSTFDPTTARLLTTVNAPKSLAAGASYTSNATLNLPSLAAGNYFLYFVADRNNDQGESGKSTNNVVQKALAVTGPNLTVTINSSPTAAIAGNDDLLPVSWTISNQTTIDAMGTWEDSIYLSTTPTLVTGTGNSWLLGSSNEPISGPLNSQSSYTVLKDLTIPGAVLAGSYFVAVETNQPQFAQAETDITDDSASAPITITLPAVTLTVTSGQAAQASVVAGENVALTYVVKNTGTAPAKSSWYDDIYYSTKNTFDSSAEFVTQISSGSAFSPPLAPGESYTMQTNAAAPINASGPGFFLIVPDASQAQGETSPATAFAVPITVAIPDVKLVTSVTAPATATGGSTITVLWQVTNAGTAAPSLSSWDDYVYFSPTPTLSSASQELATRFVEGSGETFLSPGTSYTETLQVSLPSTVGSGAYYILVQADGSGGQPQSDASKSLGSSALTLTTLTSAPAADLIVASATAPATVAVGTAFPIAFTVQNQGNAAADNSWIDAVYISNTPSVNAYSRFVESYDSLSELASGGSYTDNPSITLSSATPGLHYLVFVTNEVGQEQPELTTANNTFVVPIAIAAADLTATAASAVASAVEGTVVTVSATVANLGNANAIGEFSTWYDGVYLSDSPVLGAGSQILLNYQSQIENTGLAPNNSYNETLNVSLPDATTGNRYLLFVSDVFDYVNDPNRTNNVFAVPITITAPNLAVSNVVATPVSVEEGNDGALDVTWTVKNTSSIDATGSWNDSIYLSNSSTFDPARSTLLATVPSQSTLAAGQSYAAEQQDVLVPTETPGPYFVFVIANSGFVLANEGQPETDPTDNVGSSAVTLSAPGVDLIVSNPTAPSSAIVDQPVQVSFEVQNQGSEAALSGWSDAAYISQNNTFDGTAQQIGTFGGQYPLNAGNNHTQAGMVNIPNGLAPGTYYFFFVANANQQQGESNLSNDVSAPVQVTVNAPDLTIAATNPPSTAKLNDSLSLTWTVTNNGSFAAYAPSWYDGAYLSTTPTLSSGSLLLNELSVTNSTPLAGGATYNETLTVSLPGTFATGSIYLLYRTDIFNQQSESNATNNIQAVPITLSAPAVNLQVVANSVTVPASANVGGSLSVTWSVQNVGSDPANGAWSDAVYLSSKNTFDSSAELLGSVTRPNVGTALAGGASYSQTSAFSVPSFLATGSYYVYVVANSNLEQSESNTTDNTSAAQPIALTIPNLQVTTVTAPTAGSYGTSITVSWTVKDVGSGSASGLWEDAVYVSSSPTVSSSQEPLETFSEDRNLAVNGQYTDTESISLTGTGAVPTGTIYVIVVANAFEELTESSTADNSGSAPITLTAPNLVASNVTATPAVAESENAPAVTIAWTVTNAGPADALSTWYDVAFISTSPVFNPSSATSLGQFVQNQSTLTAGSSYTNSLSDVSLQGYAPGNYYIFVVANYYDVTAGSEFFFNSYEPESSLADNIASATLTLTVPSVDLQSSNLQVANSSLAVDQKVNVSFVVTNNGTETAKTTWDDGIFISKKSTFDATAQLLSATIQASTSPLNAGASYPQSIAMQVPDNLAPGNYFLYGAANVEQTQGESNFGNNATAGIAITVAAPDLTIAGDNVPASAKLNDNLAVSWTVTNSSPMAAYSTWYDGVYLSTTKTLGNSATLLTSLFVSHGGNPLAGGASYNETQNISIPASFSAGQAYLIFVTDIYDNQGDADRSNNLQAYPIILAAPDVNLQVVANSVTVPASVSVNNYMNVGWAVKNVGSASALGTWTDTVYLSTKNIFDNSAIALGSAGSLSPLAAGASYSQSNSFYAPSYEFTPGNYFLYVQTDSNQGQSETNISDDVSAGVPVSITIPNLQVASITAPASGTYGSTIPVSWTVKNVGTGPTSSFWYDYIYLSTTPTVTSSSTFLGSFFEEPNLAPGRQYTSNDNVPLTGTGPVPTGTLYVIVVANGSQYLTESTLTDNSNDAPIVLSAPNLAISNVSASPSSVESGNEATVNVNWTVTNTSAVDAVAAWIDVVYIGSSATFNASTATPVTTAPDSAILTAGASYTTNLTNVAIPNLSPGSYFIYVVANQGAVVANSFYSYQPETDPTDNTGSTALTLTVPAVNLTVSNPSVDTSTLAVGQSANASFTVTNAGSETANSSWQDYVYLSSDSTFDSSAELIASGSAVATPLVANGSYTQSLGFTISSDQAPGTYYLYMVANANKAQGESNYADDVSSPVQITIGAPDLTIAAINPPTSAKLDDTVSVSWKGTNSSTFAAYASWYDEVFLSSTPTYNSATATELAFEYISNPTPLAAGANYTETADITIPNVTPGPAYLLFVTDVDNFQEESNENNNVDAEPITLLAADVNLQVAANSVTAPSSGNRGSNVSVNWTVQNAGADNAVGPWQDYVYLSTSSTFDSGATLIGQVPAPNSDLPLAGGSSYDQSASINLPYYFSPGNYFLYVQTDGDGAQSETNTNDDVSAAVPLTVTAPNLQVNNVTVNPTTADYGNPVQLSWTVVNTGTGPVSGSWYDQVYLSKTPSFSGEFQFLTSFVENQNLAATNGQYTDTDNVSIAGFGTVLTGPVYILVYADAYNGLSETNTNDNTSSTPLTLTAPKLQITSVGATPTTDAPGATVKVSWTVQNAGDGAAFGSWQDAVYLSSTPTLSSNAQFLSSFNESSTLAVSGQYSDTENVTLPVSGNQIVGTAYLVVVADYTSELAQSDRSGDTGAAAITVPAPDLAVTGITAPSSALVGDAVTLGWTVTNQGSASATAPWYEGIYISPDNVLDSNAKFITAFSAPIVPLVPGASYTQSQSVTLPATYSGPEYILVVTDVYNQDLELNEGNNVTAQLIDISAADLQVSSVTAPTSVNDGQTANVSWTVVNNGTGVADQSWSDGIYLSTKNTFDSSAQFLTSVPAGTGSPLAVGASYSHTAQVTINPNSSGGSFYILVVADYQNQQLEVNENDNTGASSPIAVAQPDLQVTTVTAPTTAPVGAAITVNWTVQNVGAGDALHTWSDGIYLSTKSTFDNTAILLTSVGVGGNSPLLAGGSYSQSAQVTLNPSTPGSYFVLVYADYQGQQPESNDSNNVTASSAINVTEPDLQVTGVNAPSAGQFGEPISVSWTVQNAGSGAAESTWTDGVYVSTKSTFDASATLLTDVSVGSNSPLAAGASYTQGTQVTIPLTVTSTANTYYIYVVTNDHAQQQESNENNNTSNASTVAVTLPLLPDLTVDSNITTPANAYTGQAILVTWTDENLGTATATGPWNDTVFISTDAQGDNPVSLGTFAFSGSIDAGSSAQRTQQITLPGTGGMYWIVVHTDSDGGVNQGPFTTNDTVVSSNSISVTQAPLPDLIVTSITAPASGVLSGSDAQISFVVMNRGTAPTSVPNWQDWVVLSQDPNLAASYQGLLNPTGPGGDQTLNNQPVILGFQNPSFLNVGDSYTQTVEVPLPISAQGTWYVYVVPDGTGFHHPFSMPELSRSDKLQISSGLNITLSPPPDLTVASVQGPAQNFSGQSMTVNWNVSNIGTGPTFATGWYDAVYLSTDTTLDSSDTLLGTFSHDGSLNAGNNYINKQTVSLPSGLSGQFYVLVQTDAFGQVFENGATANNVGATTAPITINLTPPPDLAVTSVTAPATAQAGHSLSFTYQVTNVGAGSTPNSSWNDAFYLSPTPTYDQQTAISLGSLSRYGALNAGDEYTETISPTLTNGLSGIYYVLVDTDSGNVVSELNKTNNWAASTSSVQINSIPADLALSTASAPSTGLAGAGVEVNWTVTNAGLGDTILNSWVDKVYVSQHSAFDSSAVMLGTFTHQGLLQTGDSYQQSQLVSLPIALSGAYNLFVVTNADGAVYETNAGNNTSSVLPIAITQELADLQTSNVTAPAAVQTGTAITVSWTVQNNGVATTNANFWTDQVWMSTNPTLGTGGNDVMLGSLQHTNALAVGANYNGSLLVNVPHLSAGDNYYFIVVTDATGKVDDSQRSNNTAATAQPSVVTLSEAPDLTVTSVTAPVSAVSGRPMTINWSDNNLGADTGAVPITDSIFLSYDQVLDPSDRSLGYLTSPSDLAGGASVNESTTVRLPVGIAGTFYLFVETNSNGSVFESNSNNNSNYDAQPTVVTLASPADLVAGTVTIPANAVPGQNITLTYRVTNNGSNPANGSWYDSLYLSPTPRWTVSDPLLGRVAENRDLLPGESYTDTLTAPVPGIAPGSYYVILRTNITNSLPEATQSNNLSASLTQASIDAEALTLGSPTSGTLGQGQSAYYKVTVDAGETMLVDFASQATTGLTELYASYGTTPSRTQADYRFNDSVSPSQEITIPTTTAGTYYILAYGSNVPGSAESYSITASLVPFSISAVTPAQVGTGPVTLELDGSKFNGATTFQLQGPNAATVQARSILFQNASTEFATFDLTGMAVGNYDAIAQQADGTKTTLAQAITVSAAVPASLQLYLSAPQGLLAGRSGEVTVNYANAGNTDLPAPFLTLSSSSALMELPQSSYQAETVQFLGINYHGPAGVLPPGYHGSISIPFTPTTSVVGATIPFTLGAIAPSDQAMDWSDVVNSQPQNLSATAWSAITANFIAALPNESKFIAAMDADATYFSQLGEYIYDPSQLLVYELQKASDAQLTLALGSTVDAGLPTPGIALQFQQSMPLGIGARNTLGALGYGWTYTGDESASIDASGNVTIFMNGSALAFTKQTNGTYLAPAGLQASLTLVGGDYLLQDNSGEVSAFRADGKFDYTQDVNGNRISATYNSAGQMTALVDSNGSSLTIAYNAQGRISSVEDSTSRTTVFAYDADGSHLLSVSGPSGTSQYTYVTGADVDENNALASLTDPDGSHVFFTYNSLGLLTGQQQDGGADATTYAYGAAGGITVTNGNNQPTTYLFNLFGQLGEVRDATNQLTQFLYNANGELSRVVEPSGASYSYSFDVNGNVISETDPLGNTLSFSYSATTNALTSFKDALGNTTSYNYDSKGNLLSIAYPDNTKEQFSYDPLGNLIDSIDQNGNAIGYTYNNNGQIVAEQFADGSTITLAYDAHGNLTSYVDDTGTTTLQYNSADQLTKITYPSGMFLTFTYDVGGNRASSTDQTGYTIDYEYDAAGRLSGLTDGNSNLIVEYTYDGAGNLLQKDLGNGTRTVYAFNALGQVASITNLAPDHVSVNSFDNYQYDVLGNVLSDTSQNGVWTYTYNADSQLVVAQFASSNLAILPNQTIQYAYDANGNRVSQTVNGVKTTYVINNMNETTTATITGGGTTTYQYDDNGNLIASTDGSGNTIYTYDQLNELLSVATPGDSTSTYSYDLYGNVSSETIGGQTTNNLFDPAGGLFGQFDATGNLLAHFSFGMGLTSTVDSNGNSSYYDFNELGSVIGITNSAGQYENQYAYLPFGAATTISSTIDNSFTFLGEGDVIALGNGLIKTGIRVYDPTVGSFLSPDPIGLGGGQASFRVYAGDDPTTNADPSGYCSVSVGYTQGGIEGFLGAGGFFTLNNNGDLFFTATGGASTPGVTIVNFSSGDASPGLSLSGSANGGFTNGAGGPSFTTPIDFSPNPYEHDVYGVDEDGTPTVTGVKDYSPEQEQYDKDHETSTAWNVNVGAGVPGASLMLQYTWKIGNYPNLAFICPPTPPNPVQIVQQIIDEISPHDPNNIIGPGGFGDQHYVPVAQPMAYEIEYQNQPTANAPAQQVVITEQLNQNLNFASFRLGDFGFAGMTFDVPANSAFYQTMVDLTATKGYLVDVTATIDVRTGIATWTFTTIDPTTGEEPIDPTIGFLEPDNAAGAGEGFVTYTITPDSTATTGDIVNAVATVVFDTQAPLNTPTILNTLDTGTGLTSSVTALPKYETSASFNVSWSGSDSLIGSAISDFTIYVSDNDGPYTPWLQDTTLTTATFTGQDGHTYAFYSLATDNADNVQTAPLFSNTVTTLDLTAPTSTVTALPAFTEPTFTVSWSGQDNVGGSGIASYNVYVSDNGSAFTLWQIATTQTSASYTGQDGHTYGFYSVATDVAGNAQSTPTAAQATTTVDATAPTSTVTALPAFTEPTFTVSWSGQDYAGGSGLASFNVYDSDNGGAFTLWQSDTTATSATFTGQDGHTYGFYSVATDNVGNVQATPTSAQATSTVDATAPTSTVTALSAFSTATFTVAWSGQDNAGGSGIASYNVYVSDNGGGFTLWQNATSAISASYTGQDGHTYGFYSVATDNAGNQQTTPTSAQASTKVSIDDGIISGTLFSDFNSNGSQDNGEPALVGVTMFLDLNKNGALDSGEPTSITNASGAYSFTNLAPGTYVVRQVMLGGVILSSPSSDSYSLTITAGSDFTHQNFADVITSITVPLTLPPNTPFPSQGNANADYVEAVYRAVLDRNADPGGLSSWTGHLNDGSYTRAQVVDGIRNSPEHFAQEIDDFYVTLLGRKADAAGVSYWVSQLQSGVREEQIAFDFLNSPEYLGKGDKYFVDSMYLSLLGRSFDASGEGYWLGQLGDDASGNPSHPASLTHAQVINDFLFSEESLDRLVEGYYEVFLQRQADPGGLKGWVTELQDGLPFLTIGEEFISSDEFYNKAAAHK